MNKIKELRKEKNITVAELAKELGISQSMLTNYENGNGTPRDESIWEKLSQIFGVSKSHVMGLTTDIETANKTKQLKVVVDTSQPISIQPKNQTDLDVLIKLDLIDSEDMEEVSEFLDKLLAQEKYEGRRESKLRYTSAAPDSYDGWEKWSLPIGNSGIGASVFGGVQTERIQLNEKSLWSGGPSESRPDYNGGNLEEKGRNGQTVKEIQQLFANGDNDAASSKCGELVGLSDDAGVNGYGYYLSYGNMYLDFKGISDKDVENYERTLDLNTAIAGVEYDNGDTHYTRENFVSYPDNVLVTRLTAEGGDKLNLDVRVEPDNEAGGGSNKNTIQAQSYQREWETTVKDALISIDGQLKDNQMRFSSQTKVLTEGGTTEDESNDNYYH